MKKHFFLLFLYFALISIKPVFSQENTSDTDSLSLMSLEDLMQMNVTSVSKKAERLKDVPASIYVVTANDIQHSSANNILDLLREFVPGFWSVAHDNQISDIYVRSFSTGSVLFLLDGTPMNDLITQGLQNGNFDLPMSEIERIEVIKGSGGTVYGANSASGVVSIITKDPDNIKKFYGDVKISSPLGMQVNLGAGHKFSDKFSASVYGGYKYFSGYQQMDMIKNTSSTVPHTYKSGDTTIFSIFTGDDQTMKQYNAGIKLKYQISDKLVIKSKIHGNSNVNNVYNTYIPPKNTYLVTNPKDPSTPAPMSIDTTYLFDNSMSRLIGNFEIDYTMSDNHNIFAKFSSNSEQLHPRMGGGFESNNAIYDFEIQDNFVIFHNNISVGANYRMVSYDVKNFTSPGTIGFINPKSNHSITGAFVQDNISLLQDKINIFIGMKAENYSLIDDKYYFSPMVKFVVKPTDKHTVWGGVTLSHTTPGFIQTNIVFNIFRATTPDIFYNYTYPQVSQGIYLWTFQNLVKGGMDAATAQAQATAYMTTPDAKAMVESVTLQSIDSLVKANPNFFNYTGINGKNTVPTTFLNYEIGYRWEVSQNVQFESNFFYTKIEDAVTDAPVLGAQIPSPIFPNEMLNPYYYGNYLEGHSLGTETILKFNIQNKVNLEFSHSWYQYSFGWQKNSEFDINNMSDYLKNSLNETKPIVPQHIIRAKMSIQLPMKSKLTISSLFGTGYYNKFGTILTTYQPSLQRYTPIYQDVKSIYNEKYSEHDSRLLINFRIDKYLFNDKLNVYLYGKDITSSHIVESVNQLVSVYPYQVGRILGLGINYIID